MDAQAYDGFFDRYSALARGFDLATGCRTEWKQPKFAPKIPDGGFEYQATRATNLLSAVDQLGIEPRDWCLVDYGSGLGRVVLLGAIIGFGISIGLEAQEQLHLRAQENKVLCSQRFALGQCKFLLTDVREFRLPARNCFCFAFNPFSEDIWSRVLQDWRDSRQAGGRQIFVYVNPKFAPFICRETGQCPVASGPEWQAWVLQ